MDIARLMDAARRAATTAYAPYSKFRVGAALACDDGSIVTGANVENRSFGLTICAERSAIVKAISEGRRKYVALAIHCPDASYAVSPCGACRQVISEFVTSDFPIYFSGRDAKMVSVTIGELFPYDALHELGAE